MNLSSQLCSEIMHLEKKGTPRIQKNKMLAHPLFFQWLHIIH